ncbi:MAG: hypothetical protein JXQ73_25255 [Phycisphaerae bacterium]|nr:hypothetical protein [Phycisphaerae bacterium]
MSSGPTTSNGIRVEDLPAGSAPAAVPLPHFPSRLHAYVWRNWQLVPVDRLAKVVGATSADILAVGRSMGLIKPPSIPPGQQGRAYITVLRRNWHLLPYEQLIGLLDWTPARMDYTLREGDGLFWWFGGHKPRVDRLDFAPPDDTARKRAGQIAAIVRETFHGGVDAPVEPLFTFIEDLSKTPGGETPVRPESLFSPRFCYSYFGSFRQPLTAERDPYPEGLLARLAAAGVDGVWLHEPLYRLARFPWDSSMSQGHEACLARLRDLVARAKRHGVGVYLYLNEPRPMPKAFFDKHPELKGVEDTNVLPGQVATVCTSVPAVQDYLRDGVASLCRAVPDLAGIFTITASESYTNCWSHHNAKQCPRCGKRAPETVIAEVNTLFWEGIQQSGSACRLIVWDWGWSDAWAQGIIDRLPKDAYLMSVSEWSTPIERGGVKSTVGEYSLSTIGPGPRATRHWAMARKRGMKTIAKLQASTTWEIGSVPYVPVVENIAQHVANLRDADVSGLMLSWTLGGYPSPNFEAAIETGQKDKPSVDHVLRSVAARRFGEESAPAVVEAWRGFSAAFKEYPFHIGVLYHSPIHLGPANLLWPEPTGYRGSVTMGFAHPFDDVDRWRGVYPAGVYAGQLEKVADGFDRAIVRLKARAGEVESNALRAGSLQREIGVAEACAIHFRSVADQVRFVLARDALAQTKDSDQAASLVSTLESLLRRESDLAVKLHAIQSRDSRIGYEAACHYLYVPMDLVEKAVECRYLLSEWLPKQRK